MKKGRNAILLLVLIFSVLTFSQSPYLNTPTAKDYPDSDAIVLKEKIIYELENDGRISQKVFRVEKVLTYQGLDHIGDPLVSFDKTNQTLEIKRLRTYTKEGKIIDAKSNSFNEMTPFELEKSPDYTNIRQMVLTKVGMDIDSVVETEYEIKDIKPFKRNFEKVVLMMEDIPILEKEIEIRVPSKKELKIKLFNGSEKVLVNEEGNIKVYSVVLKNIPRLYHSELQNGEEYLTPFLAFSTSANWAEHSGFLIGEIEKSLKDKPKSLIDKVSEITGKDISLYEKVKSVHDFVVSKYRSVGWDLDDFDYTPRTLSRIYETKYGNSLDKAVLLGGMLETLGLKPEYYLFSQKPLPDNIGEVPSLSFFNTVVLSVSIDGRTLFLNPCLSLDEFSARNVSEKRVLRLKENETSLSVIPFQQGKNRISFKCVLEPSENFKMKGSCSISINGSYVNYEKTLKNGIEAEITSFIQSIIPNTNEVKTAVVEFTQGKIEATGTFTVDLKKDAEPKKVFANFITLIPEISLMKSFEGKSKRELPKLLPFNGEEYFEISLSIPDELNSFNIPQNVSSKGEVIIYQKATLDGNKITIVFGCDVSKNVIIPKEYEEAARVCSLISSDSCRTVIFEKKKK